MKQIIYFLKNFRSYMAIQKYNLYKISSFKDCYNFTNNLVALKLRVNSTKNQNKYFSALPA